MRYWKKLLAIISFTGVYGQQLNLYISWMFGNNFVKGFITCKFVPDQIYKFNLYFI